MKKWTAVAMVLAMAIVTTLAAGSLKAAEVAIQGTDQMTYDTTAFTVKAGETVKLTLTHAGTLPKAVMGHNVVILAAGEDVEAFSAEAAQAFSTEYFPASYEEKVIVRTQLLGPGESETVEFTAPAAGTYTFLCTFPGHNLNMRGVMTVES
ncbi:MAG: Azurin [Deltaproteobacteria bacterium]|nr:Azurin [Deltaproteobacteria bacterium]